VLSAKYDLALPIHIRNHLVPRKAGKVLAYLQRHGFLASRGLEIGCGRGWEMKRILQAGHSIVGTDLATGQVQLAAKEMNHPRATFFAADARKLPFREQTFDFAYVIGSFHHIEDVQDQHMALAEMARVVRDGGAVFLHETNPRNPLFRFYMGDIFPVLRSIDVGSEQWLDPRALRNVPRLELCDIQYFTFLPDFLPAWLFQALRPLETWLEKSPAAVFSAHYMAVFRKF
ncbi:MAG: class I SAM-dependent methyltransferase, partial [Acidobacteriota bacterium]